MMCKTCGGTGWVDSGWGTMDDAIARWVNGRYISPCPDCTPPKEFVAGFRDGEVVELGERRIGNTLSIEEIAALPKQDPDTVTVKKCCWVCESFFFIPKSNGEQFLAGLDAWCGFKPDSVMNPKPIEEAPTKHQCEHFQLKKGLSND